MLGRKTARESSDPYYDLFDDWDLIISSFLSQYGIRLSTKDFETVSWDEFRSLLAGISPDTALGRVVAIRSETNQNVIKHFTVDQKRIYDEWQRCRASRMSKQKFKQNMADLEREIAKMFR